jgi:hypothetical protein
MIVYTIWKCRCLDPLVPTQRLHNWRFLILRKWYFSFKMFAHICPERISSKSHKRVCLSQRNRFISFHFEQKNKLNYLTSQSIFFSQLWISIKFYMKIRSNQKRKKIDEFYLNKPKRKTRTRIPEELYQDQYYHRHHIY